MAGTSGCKGRINVIETDSPGLRAGKTKTGDTKMRKTIETENGKLEIITDYKWKHFKYRYEVPEKVLESEFDHLEDDEKHDGFIKYRNKWYHVSDFMAVHNPVYTPDPPEWLRQWDGYLNDSFLSGVVIKVSEDGESYMIATLI